MSRPDEIFHYVPGRTGYEKDVPYIGICGRNVTTGFFYHDLWPFLGMPVRHCQDCDDILVAAGILGLAAAGVLTQGGIA